MNPHQGISAIDWVVIGVYLTGMVAFGLWLARKTKSGEDYFLAGRNVPPLIAALSIMATQTSTNSLIGAPAFVALNPEGGLRYLQWELAVPLAMIVIMIVFVPMLWRSGVVTIYEFLEKRFGLPARLVLSGLFLISRAAATGVTVYGTAVVLEVATGAPQWVLVTIIGVICLVYSTLGGLVADVWTDSVQLVVLWAAVFISIGFAIYNLDSITAIFQMDPDRALGLDFSAHGFGDGGTYGFWPMLIGGMFLYVAYYGTDQTQVQRVLAAPSVSSARKSLFINGLLRFPLVLSYCLFGVVLAALVSQQPELLNDVPKDHLDYLVPLYIVQYLPVGIIGIIIAGMMAASMSSLDSTFNSLSAASMRDFVERFGWVSDQGSRRYVLTARAITFFWGAVCCAFAFFVDDVAPTIVESINKIGSLVYGPILAVFILAFVTRWVTGLAAIVGLLAGIGLNLLLWLGPSAEWMDFPDISWLWWNVFGFAMTAGVSALISLPQFLSGKQKDIGLKSREESDEDGRDSMRYAILALAAVGIVIIALGMGEIFGAQ